MQDIKFSEQVLLRGDLNFNFPGDWNALLYQRHKANKGEVSALAGIDGFKGWRYGSFELQNPDITWYDENDTKDDHGATHLFGSAHYPFINYKGEIHPGPVDPNVLNVIRWVPPYDGTVRISGFFAHTNSEGGNGVNIWLATMKGVDVVYSNNIETYHVAAQKVEDGYTTWDKTISVSTGKALYLVAGPDSDYGFDTCDVHWNIRYTSVPSDLTDNSGRSLRDNITDNMRHTYVMPNFAEGQSDDALLTAGVDEIKMSYSHNTFIPPSVVRIATTPDTATGASAGNGSITVKVIEYPTTDSIVWFRMTHHISNVDLDYDYDRTNKYPGMYASDANGEYTFTGLTGGIYAFGVVISSGSLGITEFDVTQTHLASANAFVERGLTGYIS